MMGAVFGSVRDRAGRLVPAVVLCSSLRGYRRSWVPADVLAALTLLVIAVPEQLATSRLADMPPITGFYAFAAGTVLFALLGSNPQMSVGADSTIAPLFAVGVGHLAPAGSPQYVDLVGILAVAVGVFVGLVWLLRLGWIAEFLSAPIIVGFLAGIAVIIVVHQIPDLFGLAGASGSTVHRLAFTVGHLGQTNGRGLWIGVAVLVIVIAAERIDRRLPGALVALVASTILVAAFGLPGDGVVVLGNVAHGAPRFGLVGLSWSTLRSVAPIAGVIALVSRQAHAPGRVPATFAVHLPSVRRRRSARVVGGFRGGGRVPRRPGGFQLTLQHQRGFGGCNAGSEADAGGRGSG